MPPDRAVCVVLGQDATVLVVLRHRDDRRYCVLPGGGIEVDERPEAAAVRELSEETGLIGSVVLDLGTYRHADRWSHYFAVRLSQPEATRPELAPRSPERERQSDTNHYWPTWIKVADLPTANLQPVEARDLVVRAVAEIDERRT